MTEIVPFGYGDYDIRTVRIDGEPWFVAKDVCDVLEIQNVSQKVADLDEDERSMFNIGRQGGVHVVNEPGLYSLILTSRKPEAKRFKRWITHEVLPALRKTGTYTLPDRVKPIELQLAQYAEASRRRDQRELAKQGLYRMPDGEIRPLPTAVPAEDVIEAKVRKTVTEIQRKAERAGDSPHEPRSEFMDRNKPFQPGIGGR
jgi:prophage antirepressor-like protein